MLYNFLRRYSWSGRAERLGFDEVWMDVTDVVDYNMPLLNDNDLEHSFFHLSPTDPTAGFIFNASRFAGHSHPPENSGYVPTSAEHSLHQRLILGSHMAQHVRHQLEEQKGFTSTVGISTNKMISKLVGNLNKPRGQTTLLPPYRIDETGRSNVLDFVDGHDIGRIPWIGFKTAQLLREYVLGRAAEFDFGLVYGGTKEHVTAGILRRHPDISPEVLERLLSGAGTLRGVGGKIFALLHGVDDTPVAEARAVPKQISIEDSYIRLDTADQLLKELNSLTIRLIDQMRIDLVEDDDDDDVDADTNNNHDDENARSPIIAVSFPNRSRRWIGRPETLRLSTRPKPPVGPDGSRPRTFKRISRSAPLPTYVFDLRDSPAAIALRLVTEVLVPLFRRLHPERSNWNLSLINVAVTNLVETTCDVKGSGGRDIERMFRQQDNVLNDFRVKSDKEAEKRTQANSTRAVEAISKHTVNEAVTHSDLKRDSPSNSGYEDDDDDDQEETGYCCSTCGNIVPTFARLAHDRFHNLGE